MFSWDPGDFSKGHISYLTSVMRGNTDLGHGQDMYCWWAGMMAVHVVKALKLSTKPTHPKEIFLSLHDQNAAILAVQRLERVFLGPSRIL